MNPEVDVTVSPIIQSVCSNNEISAIIATADGSGYASTWTRDNTTNVTGIASNGSGDITGTPVNTTLTDQIVVFHDHNHRWYLFIYKILHQLQSITI
ncbi:MAG: hypothetical protein IPP89_14265 [Saprospiraceae bacterium]|nr:hypothetical protein [Candidatus Brachybacter algidus]MBL0120101.1 hypothetical protein [Candidatus Brachybacter algidus]